MEADKALTNAVPSWVRPRLVVLARGTPEESVLAGCKTGVAGMSGSKSNAFMCEKMLVPRCMKCNKIAST